MVLEQYTEISGLNYNNPTRENEGLNMMMMVMVMLAMLHDDDDDGKHARFHRP